MTHLEIYAVALVGVVLGQVGVLLHRGPEPVDPDDPLGVHRHEHS